MKIVIFQNWIQASILFLPLLRPWQRAETLAMIANDGKDKATLVRKFSFLANKLQAATPTVRGH